MIAITEEDIVKLTNFNYRIYYKQNLQNTSVTKKGIGDIIFTGRGLGKSEHAISKHYIYILPWLKDIILEGTCDGKLYSLYKSRDDDIIGFYYIYTKIQFKNEILQVKTEISLDRQGNKFYMFSHTGLIERYLNLDLVTNNIAQGGSIKISNNIINDLLEEIKPNKFHVGDCIEITVLGNISQMKENHENKIFYHGSNYKFDTFDKSKIKENKLGLCFNFTDDYSIAYQYGDHIIKAHLDLNNPVDFNHKLTYEEDCLLCDIMGFPKISKERFEQEKSRNVETIGSLFDPFKMKPKFIEFLQALGYDGISIPEEHHYGVFEPEQINIINDYKEDVMNEELKKIKIYPKKDVNLNLEDDNEQIEESIEVGKSYKLKGMDFGDFIKDDDKDDYEVLAIKDDTVICMNKNTKEKFFFNKDVLIDPDKPEDKYTKWSIEYKEEMGGATAGEAGGASFSQLGQAPTNPMAMVKVNGVPTAGKSIKKKKKIKEDDEIETINNFNHPFIYGVSIKKLNNESYEVNFVGRQKENPKDVIPIFIARGVIFDDGEWFWFPEVTDYVRNLKDEVKYWIMDEFEDFKASNKFDALANIIKQKISNEPIDEELLDSEVSEVEDVLKHIISTLELQPIEGGLGFNYSKEGNNYTHVLSYNKYNNIITVDYLIFDDNSVRFEKSWYLNSIQEADDMEEEIYSEYDSWE